MKIMYIVLILIIFAWPLYYLYQLQLGAISFLLLAIFFGFITYKEMRKSTQSSKKDDEHKKKEKFKRNRE